jgi:hypothetical protein
MNSIKMISVYSHNDSLIALLKASCLEFASEVYSHGGFIHERPTVVPTVAARAYASPSKTTVGSKARKAEWAVE